MKIATLVKTGDGPVWIVPQILAARDSGDQVVVLLPAPDHIGSRVARELASHGVQVVESPAPLMGASAPRQLVGLLKLRATLRHLGVDVLHYHLYASALAARFATLGTSITRVYMVAGPLYLDNPTIRRVERVLCHLDHMLIAPTADVRQRYAALGMPAHRMRTVAYGVDLDHFTPADEEGRRRARADLGLGEDEFVAICVAYFYPPKRLVHPGRGVKGHEVLLAAWSRFVEQGGRGTLFVIGGGYKEAGTRYRDEVRAWAEKLPGAASVRWVDSVVDVRPYYAAADVNVVSSWSEGYGAAVEGSGSGVPTIATRAGGLPELVDSETGWLVPLGDAVGMARALAEAEKTRGTPAAHAREGAARARAERMLDRQASSRQVVAILHEAALARQVRGGGLRRLLALVRRPARGTSIADGPRPPAVPSRAPGSGGRVSGAPRPGTSGTPPRTPTAGPTPPRAPTSGASARGVPISRDPGSEGSAPAAATAAPSAGSAPSARSAASAAPSASASASESGAPAPGSTDRPSA